MLFRMGKTKGFIKTKSKADGCADGWAEEWVVRDGWMGGWVGGWVEGFKKWVDGWAEGWAEGWADGWADGWAVPCCEGWVDVWADGKTRGVYGLFSLIKSICIRRQVQQSRRTIYSSICVRSRLRARLPLRILLVHTQVCR
jgi:hypothetical protein